MLSDREIILRARDSTRVRDVLLQAIRYCVGVKYGYLMPEIVSEVISIEHTVITAVEQLDGLCQVKRRVSTGELSRSELVELYAFELAYVSAATLGDARVPALRELTKLANDVVDDPASETSRRVERVAFRGRILKKIEKRRAALVEGLGHSKELHDLVARARKSGRHVRHVMRRLDRLIARQNGELDIRILDSESRSRVRDELVRAYAAFVRRVLEAEDQYIRGRSM